MNKDSSRSTLLVLLLGLSAACLTTAAALAGKHVTESRRAIDGAMARARRDTARTAAALDGMLRELMPLAQATADDLTSGRLRDAQLADRLQQTVSRNRSLLGMGAAFQPFAFARERRLFAPYFVRRSEPVERIQLDERFDYTQFRHRWYVDTILDGAMWIEPLFGRENDTMPVMYTVPFYRLGTRPEVDGPAGIVYVTVASESIARTLDAMELGTNGYPFVLSADGHYISHPRRDLARDRVTIFETAWASGDTTLHTVAIHAIKGERGVVASFDRFTGQSSWIVYEPIPSTGWTLAVVYFQHAFQPDPGRQRRELFQIVLATIGGTVFLAAGLLTMWLHKNPTLLWVDAAALAVLLTAGIVTLWGVANRYPEEEVEDRFKVYDAAGVEQFLRTYSRDVRPPGAPPPMRVPTGVFVKSIEFASSTNVAVTGYVWQKYRKGVHDSLRRGFALPEADKPEIREIYRFTAGDEEVVGWSFAATLRQHFSYERFPFDRQDVWVRLRPLDFHEDVVLVPDLQAYQLTNPATRPGVAEDIGLPAWDIWGTYFDYRLNRYNTTFGAQADGGAKAAPELYFNASVRRRFIGPFIANVVPLAVAAAMLFALLLTGSKSDTSSRFFGFTAKDIVKGAAALFFVVSFQHISLRNNLGSPRIIYFEYFYFAIYLALMAVTINGILFASSARVRLLEFRDNLVPKLAFWPVYLACLFAITFAVLY